MKLTIDTKEDSHDDIRKAIRMLATIVGEEHVYSNSPPKAAVANIFESSSGNMPHSSSEASGSVFGNIFGDMGISSSASAQEPESMEEEKKEKPQIIIEY